MSIGEMISIAPQLAVQANAAGHTTSTLIGGWVQVQQVLGSVSIRLDGVDVFVVGVVGVHHHSQLTTLEGARGPWRISE